jgi:hypothetical protein
MAPTGGGHDFAVGITVLSGGVAFFGGRFEPDSLAEFVRNMQLKALRRLNLRVDEV